MDKYRPLVWDDYIGQERLKERLRLYIDGAVARDEVLPHVLLAGPPGCGKTTLAKLIAQELGESLTERMVVKSLKEDVLVQHFLNDVGVLFLDEIHNLSRPQQDAMLPLLQEGYYETRDGFQVEAGDLTIIGATTDPQLLAPAFLERFHIRPMFHDYTDEEMGLIVQSMAMRSGLELDDATAVRLGRAAGGVPRTAKGIVLTTINVHHKLGTTDPTVVLDWHGLTEDGLTEEHLRYITTLQKMGGKAGQANLINHMRLSKEEIANLERLLIRLDLIEYSPGGRRLTTLAYQKFNPKPTRTRRKRT